MILITVVFKDGSTEEFTGILSMTSYNMWMIVGDCENKCLTYLNPGEIKYICSRDTSCSQDTYIRKDGM